MIDITTNLGDVGVPTASAEGSDSEWASDSYFEHGPESQYNDDFFGLEEEANKPKIVCTLTSTAFQNS